MTPNSSIIDPLDSTPHPKQPSKEDRENGPTDLAKVVVDYLSSPPFSGQVSGGWLSKEELQRLISVAFFTSLSPEEGRYPRCSLFWGISPHEFFDTGEFCGGIALDVEKLRRLAPICQTRGSAIRVALRGNELQLVGMTATRFEGLDFYPGRPGFAPISAVLNVQVHILAPGHIRVECGGFHEVELRAGKLAIRQFSDLWGLRCVEALTSEFATSVANELISRRKLGDEECKLFGGLHTCLRDEKLLELILRPILDHGHGGTVLVIPNRNVSWLSDDFEQLNEVAGLNLHERVIDHLAACVEYHHPTVPSPDITFQIKNCLRTRGRVTVAARTIAEFASVDGCVVLDRSLCVLGFGAKISVSDKNEKKLQIPFKDAVTNTPVDFDELKRRGGMRWQSALRLCRAHPNVIAFVVSQDQTLKVLWSEDADAFTSRPIALPTIP